MPVHFIGKKPTNNIIFLKIISKKHNTIRQKQHDIIYNKLFMLSSKKRSQPNINPSLNQDNEKI